MHWTAGFHPSFMSKVIGPPPVMCIVRASMKNRMLSALSVAMVAAVCSCASQHAPTDLKPFVSAIRQFAESLHGLSMDEVRARLVGAQISQTEWKASGYGGKELDAVFPSYVIRVMFSKDIVVYTSAEIS